MYVILEDTIPKNAAQGYGYGWGTIDYFCRYLILDSHIIVRTASQK